MSVGETLDEGLARLASPHDRFIYESAWQAGRYVGHMEAKGEQVEQGAPK